MVGHNEYGWQRSSVSCKLQFRRFAVDEAAEKQAWQGMLHLISKAYMGREPIALRRSTIGQLTLAEE
jgi:hypothetical protein